MRKYSREQLKEMARRCLEAKRENDFRYVELVVIISSIANLSTTEVEQRIEALAK